jgi:hypothetical protein
MIANNQIPNFYSVSISGYHIAEAGANPISQLAFTLSNGFGFKLGGLVCRSALTASQHRPDQANLVLLFHRELVIVRSQLQLAQYTHTHTQQRVKVTGRHDRDPQVVDTQ